jgi:serine/threonine protein kinase
MPLAAGGMARIYIGRTTGIGSFERHVVLKLITPEREKDTIAVQMFLDEARLAASLNHQNVGQVFEVGADAGIHYLAMEYVHGQDLRALLAKAGSEGTRVPLELALTVTAGAAAGLNHAHERRGPDGTPLGIVHRDVSPSNIMIGYDGSVKLLDFGIAKATARSVETQSGIIKGKFAYMSPEQCRGREVDRRSDVFSLGIILYEITTQHRCFRADSDFDTMHRIVTGDVVRPSRLVQNYPQALEAIVLKALAVDANQRYQSAGLLLEAMESFAVSSRMSLSTMSLGRFMRDMFGDQPEPWLNAALMNQEAVVPKETTVSNTNGTGSAEGLDASTAIPQATSRSNDFSGPGASGSLDMEAATILQTPDDDAANEDAWNAKSYPTLHKGSSAPDVVRASQPALQPVRHPSTLPLQAPSQTPPRGTPRLDPNDRSGRLVVAQTPQHNQTGPMLMPAPAATQGGLPQASRASVPAGQFGTPGSGSGPSHPSHPALQIPTQPVTTRHGYASAAGNPTNDMSYPRYESGAEAYNDDVQLKPNRRPLFIGLGLAAVGLVVLLVIMLAGGGNEKSVVIDHGSEDTPPTEPIQKMDQGTPQKVEAPAPPEKAVIKPETKAETKPETTPDVKPEPTAETKPETAPVAATPDKDPTPTEAHVAAPVEDASIEIDIQSTPSGADVLLAGKPLGTTPLKTNVPRGTGSKMITVHKAGFVDNVKEIDLREDFSSEVALKKVADDRSPTTKTTTTKTSPKTTTATPPTTPKADPKKAPCQPPGMSDPFDQRPPCKQ